MDKVAEVLTRGAARSGVIELYLPKLLKGDLSPGFKAEHLKNLGYALEEARKRGLKLPGTELAYELRPPHPPQVPPWAGHWFPHWSGFHPSFGGQSGRPEFPPCRMPGGGPPGNNAYKNEWIYMD